MRGDRNYRRRTGRRRFAVLGVPVLPRGCTGPVVECAACHTHFGTEVLDRPTTSRFSAMLRDGVHTVALAVLSAGGTDSRAVLDRAVSAVRSAGFAECTAVQLVDLVEALEADTGRFMPEVNPEGTLLAIELHEALEPLAPHLAPPGGSRSSSRPPGSPSPTARTARPRWRSSAPSATRSLPPDDTVRLLTSARTVS